MNNLLCQYVYNDEFIKKWIFESLNINIENNIEIWDSV